MKNLPLIPSLLCASIAFFVSTACQAQENETFPLTILNIGKIGIRAEVATTEGQRNQGLMHRDKLDKNAGMVSVLAQSATICMWSKNVLIPVSVAFLDKDGKIVNIDEMKANSTDKHCARRPISYALEMNSGWFKTNNIKPGDKVDNLPAAH
jgi:uncharacterized protein